MLFTGECDKVCKWFADENKEELKHNDTNFD